MPVRVYLFKHTANEMLERTTGEQYSGLQPKDPNKRFLMKPSILPKAMINKTFQYVSSIFTEGFQINLWPLPSPFTSSKSNCFLYEPHPRFLAQNKCGLYTSVNGTYHTFIIQNYERVFMQKLELYNLRIHTLFLVCFCILQGHALLQEKANFHKRILLILVDGSHPWEVMVVSI